MRLCHLGEGVVELHFQLLVCEFGKLLAEVFVDKFSHVPLVIAGDFLSSNSLIEEIPIEFSHHSEAGPEEVPIFLCQL